MRFDVCNGDADGLCATVQWHWHEPAVPAQLITGLKREIALLERVLAQAGDQVNVFDLSMQRNQPALERLLDAGVAVRYVDHHETGAIRQHPLLKVHIDLDSAVCTSLLVDRLVDGASRPWALVGAYGDNLTTVADELAQRDGLSERERAALRRLGEGINYNAYGETLADVHMVPERLFGLLVRFRSPLDLVMHDPIADELDAWRRDDLRQARALKPVWEGAQGRVLCLPDEAWARRVVGVLANELAHEAPEQAHAVLCLRAKGHHVVSLRAPLARPGGAATLCQVFGGNGRARAAGIDVLAAEDLPRFIDAFAHMSWGA